MRTTTHLLVILTGSLLCTVIILPGVAIAGASGKTLCAQPEIQMIGCATATLSDGPILCGRMGSGEWACSVTWTLTLWLSGPICGYAYHETTKSVAFCWGLQANETTTKPTSLDAWQRAVLTPSRFSIGYTYHIVDSIEGFDYAPGPGTLCVGIQEDALNGVEGPIVVDLSDVSEVLHQPPFYDCVHWESQTVHIPGPSGSISLPQEVMGLLPH